MVDTQQASGIDPSKPLGSIPASLWDLSQQASGIGPSKPQAGHHIGSMGTIKKTHQDTPVLHNSNWGGTRTGVVLMGFEGFRATSGRRVLNN